MRTKRHTLSMRQLMFAMFATCFTWLALCGTAFADSEDWLPEGFDFGQVPAYDGTAYTVVNDNVPYFTEDEITKTSFETYEELDDLGRCTQAFACLGTDTMPWEERGNIGSVKPSGWQTVKYPGIVDGNYLYNRCHLIAYMLSGENANEKNLITGTRYLNIEGMLPFETKVGDFIEDYMYHVMYRVTPVFVDDELVARGVLMEGQSVEDYGRGIEFCIFAYNVQPGIGIDYATGDSWENDFAYPVIDLDDVPDVDISHETTIVYGEDDVINNTEEPGYVLNTNSKVFHFPGCSSVKQMSAKNKQQTTKSREEIIADGYRPCGNCNP